LSPPPTEVLPTLFELSDKKQEILAHTGHLLVRGGPGSGKTTIAILKADTLLKGALRSSQNVLFLSFARATVARVLDALNALYAEGAINRKSVSVDTYHAFFWRLIRTHGYLLGLPRRLRILTPAGQAVALSPIRHEFGSVRNLNAVQRDQKRVRESDELRRLAFEEGQICFDLFANLVGDLLTRSAKIRELVSRLYPVVILDEFQDTNAGQWRVVQQMGAGSTIIALADEEQRIYDFIGADPERLNHFRQQFSPKEVDLGGENHRSTGTDIAQFGNDVLTGSYRKQYQGMYLIPFGANENQAFVALKVQTLQGRKRLIETKPDDWSLAVLVPTKRMMRHVSDMFRTQQGTMPVIAHQAAIDLAGAVLSAEIIAFLLQPQKGIPDRDVFVELVCNYFRGRGGDDPSLSDIGESMALRKALDAADRCRQTGKSVPAKSIIRPVIAAYEQGKLVSFTGNPDGDWATVRALMAECGCKRLGQVAEEARNVRLLDRGALLRDQLSEDWRTHGGYVNALTIVRLAFTREHFATATRSESGVVVMNMHKAKGKQFDEVVIFEGWPRRQKGKIVSNPDRIVRGNIAEGDLTHARHTFRVSVTRAKSRTTILTPENDPCILLRPTKAPAA
jgi:DNA helicase II / ATP-dependent DNA helicase PcrA